MRVKTTLVTAGLLAIGAAYLYKFWLSDEAKSKLKSAATSVKSSYDRISQIVEDAQGVTMKDESPLPKRPVNRSSMAGFGILNRTRVLLANRKRKRPVTSEMQVTGLGVTQAVRGTTSPPCAGGADRRLRQCRTRESS